MKRLFSVGAFVIVLLTLYGCSSDCIWRGTGVAYMDENRNDLLDPGEPPLEGVKFVVDDAYNNLDSVDTKVSDIDGFAELYVWLPGCPKTDFEIRVEVPDGYGYSGPARVKGSETLGERYLFGFWPVR